MSKTTYAYKDVCETWEDDQEELQMIKYAFREQSLSCSRHLNNLLDLNVAEFL
jgi:hypothetical protein